MATTVAVAMVFVSVIVELRAFATMQDNNELSRILITPKIEEDSGDDSLPIAFYQVFKQIDGAKVVQHVKGFGGRHESGATYYVIGEDDSGVELGQDYFPVEPAVFEAWKKEPRLGAIVTEETAAELNLKVGALAEVPTSFGPLQIKVVGLSRKALVGHRMAVHFSYLQEFTKDDKFCEFRVYTAPDDFERVAKAIIERTKNTPTPVQAFSGKQFASNWVKRVAMVPTLLGFLGAFLLFTTLLTLSNNTAISIRERRTETATLRVLGFRKRMIVRLLLSESVVVGIVGGLLAVAVTALVLRGGMQLTPGADRLLQKVTLSWFSVGCGLVVSILVPLAGALPAAVAAVRMPLVEALRDTA